jgi:hypothetical protein
MVTVKSYTIIQIRHMMAELEGYINQIEETLGNEEGKDYPRWDRMDALQTRLGALQAAYDALAEIE